MHITREITKDTHYVGGSERRLALFENIYPLNNGVSYNSYLILDDKTALLDTVDHSIKELFFENLDYLLGDRKLNYLIINHMEPDHA
ncbi:MAG: FprA family A-type flavoprotein, partial [Bacilli bacterium]|nr:FprA family A-type flavoprotein [Bacilli bacterium]